MCQKVSKGTVLFDTLLNMCQKEPSLLTHRFCNEKGGIALAENLQQLFIIIEGSRE